MTDLRQFIKNLGDKAPEFFGTKEATIKRWLKTGSLPMKATQKILMAIEAANGVTNIPNKGSEPIVANIDPMTKLPTDIRRGLPPLQGQPPAFIEEDPREQSFGLNLTRPGRAPQPLPPMKIKKVDGKDVPYVDQHPKATVVLPPTIAGDNTWGKPYEQPFNKQPEKG